MAKESKSSQSGLSKKIAQYTKTLKERKALFSRKKQPNVNYRDCQTLCYESSMEYRFVKTV